MFRVERFHRVAQGEYRATITLDDPGILPALRFLRRVSDVAERLHRRIDQERRVLELTDRRREQEPQARAERARILALYRELPGPRSARLKALRRILLDQYARIGYDGVVSVISMAIAEERTFRTARVRDLAGEGLTCREIATRLRISPAQVSRLSGPRRGDARGCPINDDLTPGPQERAENFRALTTGGAAAAV